jgi:hypothetical protein
LPLIEFDEIDILEIATTPQSYLTQHDEVHTNPKRPHHSNLTTKEMFFRTLDPKEWVFLCYNDHRGVHWSMNTLGLERDDLKRKEMMLRRTRFEELQKRIHI